jgi:hypothetical protein
MKYFAKNYAHSLYAEDIVFNSYKSEKIVKSGRLKKLALASAISIPIFFGYMDRDVIGTKEAHAAGNGYISGSVCPPSQEPQQPYYYKWTLTRQDNQQVKTLLVPSSRLRANFTGLDEGVIYEVKVQACIKDQNGAEKCSQFSANKPLGVARLYGNLDTKSVPATANRIDSYDSALFNNVYTGRDTNPEKKQVCDFNGDGAINSIDLNLLRVNYGKVQANPLGTAYVDCSGGRCPETGSCNQPY